MPAPAPGRDMEQMARIINRTNSIGIMILADFQYLFHSFDNDEMGGQQEQHQPDDRTPGVADKAVEGCDEIGCRLPGKLLVAASPINSSVHPATTE